MRKVGAGGRSFMDSWWKLFLFSHLVSPGDETQVTGFGNLSSDPGTILLAHKALF